MDIASDENFMGFGGGNTFMENAQNASNILNTAGQVVDGAGNVVESVKNLKTKTDPSTGKTIYVPVEAKKDYTMLYIVIALALGFGLYWFVIRKK